MVNERLSRASTSRANRAVSARTQGRLSPVSRSRVKVVSDPVPKKKRSSVSGIAFFPVWSYRVIWRGAVFRACSAI